MNDLPTTFNLNYFVSAISEVYKNEGNDEYRKKDFSNAVYFYTEGIKVICKDKELKAQLHNNRAIAHFYLGKNSSLRSDFHSGCLILILQ